jgi:hypothetical protein
LKNVQLFLIFIIFSNFLAEITFKIFNIRTSYHLSHSIIILNKLLSHDLKINLIWLIKSNYFLCTIGFQVLLKWILNFLWFFLAITLKIKIIIRIFIKVYSPNRFIINLLKMRNLTRLLIFHNLILMALIIWNILLRINFTLII